MSENPICRGKTVRFHFVLRDEAGDVLDDSHERGQPMGYIHGFGQVHAGLEQALDGRAAGDHFRVEVPPALGYGERRGEALPIPIDKMPSDLPLHPGATFTTQGPGGRTMMLWVDRVEGDQVWIDPNHPLAGKTLSYEVEVVEVREPTEEERKTGVVKA